MYNEITRALCVMVVKGLNVHNLDRCNDVVFRETRMCGAVFLAANSIRVKRFNI